MLFIQDPVVIIYNSTRKTKEEENIASELIRQAQNILIARSEVKSKSPKNSPRRESQAASEGATKVGAARSMAQLIRKPRLRQIVGDEGISDIEPCFRALYAAMLYRIKGGEESLKMADEVVAHISPAIAELDRLFHSAENGQTDLFEGK